MPVNGHMERAENLESVYNFGPRTSYVSLASNQDSVDFCTKILLEMASVDTTNKDVMPTPICCVCDPGNSKLCCDRLACCPGAPQALNGNYLVEVVSSPGPPPLLDVHISHMAGRLCDLLTPQGCSHFLFLPVIAIFFIPLHFILSTFLPVETRLHLRRRVDGVAGIVTRKTACCTCMTEVVSVTAIQPEDTSGESEGPSRIYLHYATGASKMMLSEGSVYGLEGAVNPWIRGESAL